MVPVTVITGFLGAGKTSLVNNLLANAQGRRIAVLVNDFGAVNIDAALIRSRHDDVIALENGCICCSLSDGLVAAVAGLIRRPEPPEHIVVETSGISDPIEIANALADPDLQRYAPLDGIVSLVDPESVSTLADDARRLAERQVEAADIVLLNKTDLAPEEACTDSEAWIRGVSPGARILRTRHGVVPIEILFGIERVAEPARWAVGSPVVSDAFDSVVFRTGAPITCRGINRLLSHLPNDVYRVKGLLNLAERPTNRCILQATGNRASMTVGEPWEDEARHSVIVFIGRKGATSLSWITRQLEEDASLCGPKEHREQCA